MINDKEKVVQKTKKNKDEVINGDIDELVIRMIKKYTETPQFEMHKDSEFKELVRIILESYPENVTSFEINYDTFVHSICVYLESIILGEDKNITEGLNILQKLLELARESDILDFNMHQTKLIELGIINTIFKLFTKGSLEVMNMCIKLLIELMRNRNVLAQEKII